MTTTETSAAEPVADSRAVRALIKDRPPVALLREDSNVVDRFGSSDVASRLAKIIERVDPPYTISISGSWGVGKTTLAHQLQQDLRAGTPTKDRVRTAQIDLWAEDISDLRRRVALEVAVALEDDSPGKREEALKAKAKAFDKEIRTGTTVQDRPRPGIPKGKWNRLVAVLVLVVLTLGFVFLAGFTVDTDPAKDNLGAKVLVSFVAAGLIWILIQSGLVLSVSTSSSSTQPIAEKVGLQLKFKEEVTRHQDRKVLVILDNLDRLTGESAVEALSEIRSFVEFPQSRCVFLVPQDRDALERHLQRTMGGDAKAARDYLDKFFNLDILLTKPVASDLRTWTRELLTGLFPDVGRDVLSPVAEYAAAGADGSPRATKRILNGIYTRAYLLPPASTVRLDELAVVEALIAKFPTTIERLNSNPRAWLEAADSVRSKSTRPEQRADLRWLLGSIRAEADGMVAELEDQETAPFLTFLMLTRNVPLRPESVRAILSLRPDRQWAHLHRGDEASDAVRSGDTMILQAILNDTAEEDQAATVRAAVDQIEHDRRQDLSVAVVNGINAVAPVVGVDQESVSVLRTVAADFLASGSITEARSLTFEAVDFIFADGLGGIHRGPVVVERLAAELTPGMSPDARSIVRAISKIAPALDEASVKQMQPVLAKLTDAEVGSLFDDLVRTGPLVSSLEAVYVERLTTWDASADNQALVQTATERLRQIRGTTGWVSDDAADKIATRATSQVPALDEDSFETADGIAAMLADAPKSTSIDAFAGAIVESEDLTLFENGLELASNPTTLLAPITKRMTAAGFDEFSALVADHRETLERSGFDVSAAAAARWAAGQGIDYARIVLSPGRPADADAIAAAIAKVPDETNYIAIIEAVLPLLEDLDAERAAAGLISDIARRMPTFVESNFGPVSRIISRLQEKSPSAEVVDAVKTAITGATTSDITRWTSATRALVDAKVTDAAVLPPILAQKGAAIGAADLGQAAWLQRQRGVSRGDVRTAVVAMVMTLPPSEVDAAIAPLARPLDEAWQVGKALVERAAASPPGPREELLQIAEGWKVPPSRERESRDDYVAALDTVSDDPSVLEIVARLRARL